MKIHRSVYQGVLPAAELERAIYNDLREDILSGELLFELHSEYAFTRPGSPTRRALALGWGSPSPGEATRTAATLVLKLAELLDNAGRQNRLEYPPIVHISSYGIAHSILDTELNALHHNEDDDEDVMMSAAEMTEKITDQYAEWAALPPDQIESLPNGDEPILFSARMVQGGLNLLQEKLIAEANAI
jgi:hypothetical protein